MEINGDWEDRALCQDFEGLYESVMFGAHEKIRKQQDRDNIAKAKRLCIACPVRKQCLDSALQEESFLSSRERFGVRGGLTAKERIDIAAQDPMCARCGVTPINDTTTNGYVKRLCRTCQLSIQSDVLSRYFPQSITAM